MPNDTAGPSFTQRTAQGHSRASLDNAGMATFLRHPKSEEAKQLVASLVALTVQHETEAAPRARARSNSAQRSFEQAVGAFASDLIAHQRNVDAEGFMYRLSDKDMLSDTLVSVRCFEQLRSSWFKMGLLEETQFFRAQETMDDTPIEHSFGKARRFRATSALVELADSYSINPENLGEHFAKDYGRSRIVTVRTEKQIVRGKKLQPRNIKCRGFRYDEESARVREINSYLEQSGFDLDDAPRVYRLFNCGNRTAFDFNLGGRLYCHSDHNWQNMKREERSKITWRGQLTAELDIRASHLFILYALNGQPLPYDEDPYHIPAIERDVVKGVFTAICGGGKKPTRWPKELNKRYREATGKPLSDVYKLKAVTDALYSKHPVLNTISTAGLDWARLQYEESECFVTALLHLGREHGLSGLPIHDSLIVPHHSADIAEGVLSEAYRQRFGYLVGIKRK
jgi:hypothetical protein